MTLMEVPYINGYKEFEEILGKEVLITIDESTFEYKLELVDLNIIKESISYINLSGTELFLNFEVLKTNGKTFLLIQSNKNLKNVSIKLLYSFNNTNPKGLYSVDYGNGKIYFSEEITNNLNIKYSYDNILCTGKSANQLHKGQFIEVNKNINISNFKDNAYIYFVYKDKTYINRNITPILQNLKLNYITKDGKSL